MSQKNLSLDIHDKPSIGKWIILSLQHVFAMFGATILVPLLTGMSVGVALITSGIGTLIYILCTKAKVPMYLGSSFAYIAAVASAIATEGLGTALLGIILVGVVYILIAIIIKFAGTNWLHKLLPPVVIGPMIMIIGLGLAPTAIGSIGLSGDTGYTARELADLDTNNINNNFYSDFDYSLANYQLDLDTQTWVFNSDDLHTFFYVTYDASGNLDKVMKFAVAPVPSLTENEYNGIKDGTLSTTLSTGYSTPEDVTNDANLKKFTAYAANPEESHTEVATSIYIKEGTNLNQFQSKSSLLIPLVALITFVAVILIAILAKGFLKVIPFIIAILVGYAAAAATGLVDWSIFSNVSFFQLPEFSVAWLKNPNFITALTFIPLAFVTISEHIGDHIVLGEIIERDFLNDPGLDKTLLGDGIATLVAGAIGGPANTSYGENTSVVGLTKVASVWVTGLAAIIAILLGFFGYIQAFIASIPWAVIGGITIVLYGFIAGNGVKVLIKDRTDLGNTRNLIIVSTMLVLGLGGAMINFSSVAGLSGMALAAVVGIILNLVLPNEKPETINETKTE